MSALPPESGTGADQQAIPQTRAHLRQLTLQCAAAFTVLSLAWPYFVLRNETLPWPATALAIGAIALLLASLTRQPWWWRLIHMLFAPLAWAIAALSIAPGWFLLAFILLLLVYRGALTDQIPLYLSSKDTAAALAELMSECPGKRFLDLGAGIGSVLRPLARALPEAQFTGIENAPATWLAGYLCTAGLPNCSWHWGDIWRTSLTEYDLVYAFLSPAPMPALWEKVKLEMPSGSLFISNNFPVPGVEASSVVEIDDARQTRLYCYRR
ncbi:class I SAM-dependent methyltransferase [Propionivibrio sp.]|uniref:class I SAM-dependent methyltransferase n=1 Tax=Propionivibrio sp. TaxID=2212460 RepID=UPI0025DE160E|nr:class I SAM-dependent methyltransferase [Propionivibrio sp.]